MEVLKYAVWAIVFFFALSWTLGLLARPDMRLKSNIVTVIIWWGEVLLVFLNYFSVFHLLWVMPITLIAPGYVQHTEYFKKFSSPSLTSVFIRSGIPIGLIIAAVIYLSR